MKRSASSIDARRPVRVYARRFALWSLVLVGAWALLAYGFATFRPGPRGLNDAAVPSAVADKITVLGIPNGRFWAWYDLQGAALVREWEQSLDRERATGAVDDDSPLPPAHFLAISGGGADGAFGAG